MPIRLLNELPAIKSLKKENIFVLQKSRNIFHNSHYLKILILNLMPKKIETELQFLRLLSSSPLKIDIYLLRIDGHIPKNTPLEHLNNFYCKFSDIQYYHFDGLIVTGAPLGLTNFNDITFWPQIKKIFSWAKDNITSILFICWAVQAALHILYKFPKLIRKKKLIGIYQHKTTSPNSLLTKGFDEIFTAPHSRYSDFPKNIISETTDLKILSESEDAGIYLLISKNNQLIFITGHPEYDTLTLSNEYHRDLQLGLNPVLPNNYFPNNNPYSIPKITWRSHAYLLFSNWIHHYVYRQF